MNTKGVEDGMVAKRVSEALTIPCDRCGATAHKPCYWGDGLGTIPDAFHLRRMVAAAMLPKPAELELKGEGGELGELLRTVRPATNEELIEQGNNLAKNYKPGPRQAVPFMPSAAVPVEERTDIGHDFSTPDGELDEVFIENAFVHIERMDDMCFWIGVDSPGKHSLHVRTGVEDGVWWFSVEEDALSDGKYLKVERHITPPVPERTAEMEQLMGRESPEDAFRRGQELMRYNASRVATRYGTLIEAKDVANYPLFDYHAPLDHIEGKAKAVSQEVKE